MSAILSIQNNTIYFEQFVRDQLKTQESEMRAELKDRESEMREAKVKNTTNTRMIEELRPLCEELPPDALDPVTYEPFNGKNIPAVYSCGHVFNKETVKSIILSRNLEKRSDLDCPTCKIISRRDQLLECIPLEGLVEHMEKITKVFKENTENEPT